MPAVMEQIGRMSIEERQKLADWILEGIRTGTVTNAPTRHVYRTTEPDPALKGEILCDLFAGETIDEIAEQARHIGELQRSPSHSL